MEVMTDAVGVKSSWVGNAVGTSHPNPDLPTFQSEWLWALLTGAFLAFALGFGMGANDVSNAFGTSVGSKVLTIRQAYVLATIFETLGAVLVGFSVTDTMRKGVVDIEMYKDEPGTLLVGQVAILGGSAIWLLLATFGKLPVSTTQSVVGATVGFSLLVKGLAGIQWWEIIEIVASWFISPLLSGLVSSCVYMAVDFTVFRRKDPIKCGLLILPFVYFFCIAFNLFSTTFHGSEMLKLSNVPLWAALCVSLAVGVLSGLVVEFLVKPRLIRWINYENRINPPVRLFDEPVLLKPSQLYSNLKKFSDSDSFTGIYLKGDGSVSGGSGREDIIAWKIHKKSEEKVSKKSVPKAFFTRTADFFKWLLPDRERKEDEKTLKLFSSVQVITACFAGFAHGASDVSNAIAPLTALWSIYNEENVAQEKPTPIYVLLFGVVAICTGFWFLGHKVIGTLGQKMSKIHPASGFAIEFGASITIVCASKAGLPVSTTHCLVGSIVAVGLLNSEGGVNWKVLRNVVFSWLVTLPASALFSAGIVYFLV